MASTQLQLAELFHIFKMIVLKLDYGHSDDYGLQARLFDLSDSNFKSLYFKLRNSACWI